MTVRAWDERPVTSDNLTEILQPLVRSRLLTPHDLGRSIEQRPISAFFVGQGPTRVLLWSQAHGDASLGTKVLADLLRFLTLHPDHPQAKLLRETFSFAVIPILNPDGAEYGERRNSQGIDVLLDERAGVSPEARTLRILIGSHPFRYAVGLESSAVQDADPAGDLLLWVPASRAEAAGDTAVADTVHARAVQLAGTLGSTLGSRQQRVERHGSPFDSRFLPDQLRERETSTVLLGTGVGANDREDEQRRRSVFVALVSALHALAVEAEPERYTAEFNSLPVASTRDTPAADVLLRAVTLRVPGIPPFESDVAIRYADPAGRTDGRIVDIGDLRQTVAPDSVSGRGLAVHFAAGALQPASMNRYRLALGTPARFAIVRRVFTHRATVYVMGDGALDRTPDYHFPRRARWFVSIHPQHLGREFGGVARDIEVALNEVGWNHPLRITDDPGPQSSRSAEGYQVSAGYTFRGALAVEVLGGRAEGWSTSGYRYGASSVTLDQSGGFYGALLSYEYRNLRFGAGPALLQSDWRWTSSDRGTEALSGRSQRVGYVWDLGISLPAGTPLGWEMRLRHKNFRDFQIEGFQDIPSFSARHNTLSLGIGVVMRR